MDALVSSGSNVRPCHYRVRLYDVSQPPFLLEHQLSSCWRDAGVSSSFNCVQSFLNHWQTLWKYIIQFGWCNAARPERFMINFAHLHPLTVSSSDEVGHGSITTVSSFSHRILEDIEVNHFDSFHWVVTPIRFLGFLRVCWTLGVLHG